MAIGITFERFGRSTAENLGFAAVAVGVAAVAIWAIPGVKLTLAGAGIAALVSGLTSQLLFESSHHARKYDHLTRFVSLIVGFNAANLVGATVGFIANAVNSFVAYHLGSKLYEHLTA